ncbi:MAG TPA: nuclear transport factor 2 family protein [Terriglobales bacterium]|jgi:ketosteroid isomerase-like protein
MLQRKLILLPLIFLLSLPALAQSPSANQEEKLIALEKMWDQAQLLHDAGALERLVSPDFVNTEWDGTVSDRTKYLSDIRDPLYKPATMSIRDVSIKLYGSTAIVVGVYHAEGRYRDRPFDHVGRFTDTWILIGDRWQCVASHASLIGKR